HRAVAPPTNIDLIDLIGRDVAESPRVIEGRWERGRAMLQGGNPLSAVIGSTGERTLSFVDAPVTIVGGATGSGKTAFLRSLLLSLASSYPPDQLGLVLVDFRGGAAFAPLDELPHTVAHVNDLTPQGAERLLIQLRNAARQLSAQQRRSHRLIVVIDEATGIEAEHPGLLLALTRIANQAQAGVSLILASQRPSLLPEDVRRSARTTVALRTADAEDSRALISSERAAAIPPRIPGRAIRLARGRIEEFQSAYGDGWAASRRTLAAATAADFGFGEERPRDGRATIDRSVALAGETDSHMLVAGIASAFAARPSASGIRLPGELSTDYDLLDLLTQDDCRIALGMQEDPQDATQSVAVFAPDEHRHLGILGSALSGRTTALRTLAISAAFTREGVPVEVYAVGAELDDLAALGHVGAVVDGDDGYRVRRLLIALCARISERSMAIAAHAGRDFPALRTTVGLPGSVSSRILLLLDEPRLFSGWTSGGEDVERLRMILRVGPAAGVHVIAAGPETLLRHDLSALIAEVVELRPERAAWRRAALPPGRGLWAGREVQLA
ncbi:MAG: FtsK/SpoIIIE domain-containing protein, partial [Microbacterium sp.]